MTDTQQPLAASYTRAANCYTLLGFRWLGGKGLQTLLRARQGPNTVFLRPKHHPPSPFQLRTLTAVSPQRSGDKSISALVRGTRPNHEAQWQCPWPVLSQHGREGAEEALGPAEGPGRPWDKWSPRSACHTELQCACTDWYGAAGAGGGSGGQWSWPTEMMETRGAVLRWQKSCLRPQHLGMKVKSSPDTQLLL